MLGVTSGLFGDHWVSSSLEGVRRVLLQVLVVLLCSVYWVFSCRLPFIGSPPLPPPFIIVLIIIYPIGSPVQFSTAGAEAGAGFFWCAELVVGLSRAGS